MSDRKQPQHGKGDRDRTTDHRAYWDNMERIFGKRKTPKNSNRS